MSNKRLVFDPDLLYQVTIDERVRDQFISDNYDLFWSVFEGVLLRYGLPTPERDDIIQDSIIKLREALGSGNFKPENIKDGDLARWALSIPINKAKDFLKSHRNPWGFIPLDTVREDGALEGGPASVELEDYSYETNEGPAHEYDLAHEATEGFAESSHPQPDEYIGTNLDAERNQQFPRPDDDGAARDRLLALLEIYETHPLIQDIVSLKLTGRNLKEIAAELGLSYSNTRQIWARFRNRVLEGEAILKRIREVAAAFSDDNFLPAYIEALLLPRPLVSAKFDFLNEPTLDFTKARV